VNRSIDHGDRSVESSVIFASVDYRFCDVLLATTAGHTTAD